jgi:NADPH-dependent 2,4-dienoyl-CoA reductase/sulfur reductase-like enzyme
MTRRNDISRRQFLQAGSATLAALGAPGLLAGCASSGAAAPKARVAVVGGGWGGMGVARALLREDAGLAVTLVEANPRFMSCPMSTHYIAGHAPAADFQFGYEGLDRAGVARVTATVADIDRAGKALVLGDGRRIAYDFLVLSPGIEYMEETIAGLDAARSLAPAGFRAFEQSAVKAQFDRFLAEGGEFIVTVPPQPYRCPPAPHERAFLLAELMRSRRVKGKVLVLDANPAPMPPPIRPAIIEAYNERYRDLIEYVPAATLTGIDAASRTVRTSVGDFKFTAANVVPPMRAPALIRKAGLGERWANVKLPSFQSAVDENVYVIGDAVGAPLPKSGHLAFETGARVAAHIALRVRGAVTPASAGRVDLPNAICFGWVSHSEAFAIHVGASMEAGAAPQLSFKVDPKASPSGAASARDWANTMWKAMLA